jgi:hypothetical protein
MGGRTSTSWKPGRSANPGGRPKNVVNVQELARSYTEAAIETLAKALADPKLRVQAAVAILDRGWGRPTQVVAGDEDRPPVSIEFLWQPAEAASHVASAVVDAAVTDAGTHSDALTLEWGGPETC